MLAPNPYNLTVFPSHLEEQAAARGVKQHAVKLGTNVVTFSPANAGVSLNVPIQAYFDRTCCPEIIGFLLG
jgi:hypothetical protein